MPPKPIIHSPPSKPVPQEPSPACKGGQTGQASPARRPHWHASSSPRSGRARQAPPHAPADPRMPASAAAHAGCRPAGVRKNTARPLVLVRPSLNKSLWKYICSHSASSSSRNKTLVPQTLQSKHADPKPRLSPHLLISPKPETLPAGEGPAATPHASQGLWQRWSHSEQRLAPERAWEQDNSNISRRLETTVSWLPPPQAVNNTRWPPDPFPLGQDRSIHSPPSPRGTLQTH